jgi:hypothetical protein
MDTSICTRPYCKSAIFLLATRNAFGKCNRRAHDDRLMLVRIDPFLPLTVPSIPISSNCFFSRQRDLLKSVHHLEAALVFRRKCRIARPVDHQRLHASRDRSLDLLDIVAEEEDSSGLKLEKESTCQHHIYSLTFAEEKQKKKKLTSNACAILS